MNIHRFRKYAYWISVFALLVFALWMRINVAVKHSYPEGDEGAWLRCAAHLLDKGYVISSNVVEHDLYHPQSFPHPEDNRWPLYPMVIRAAMIFSDDAFAAGQFVNIATFAALFFFVLFAVRKKFGYLASLSSLVFISVSPILIIYSTHIYPDLALALGFVAVLWSADDLVKTPWRCAAAGGVMGVLFLLKTTAILLLPVFAVLCWIKRRDKDFLRHILFLLIPFLLLIAPWLIRNTIYFGSPLFQTVNFVMYLDNRGDYYTVGVNPPNLLQYIQMHGAIFVFLMRPLHGFLNLIRDFGSFDHGLSCCLLPLCAVGILGLKGKRKIYLPTLAFAVLLTPLMAYIAYLYWVSRYTMAYYIWLYILAGIGIGFIMKRLPTNFPARLAICGLCVCAPLASVVYPCEYYLSDRGNERPLTNVALAVAAQTSKLVPESCVVFSPVLPDFEYEYNIRVLNQMVTPRPADLYDLLRRYHASYMLLDSCNDGVVLAYLALPASGFVQKPLFKNGPFTLYSLQDSRMK